MVSWIDGWMGMDDDCFCFNTKRSVRRCIFLEFNVGRWQWCQGRFYQTDTWYEDVHSRHSAHNRIPVCWLRLCWYCNCWSQQHYVESAFRLWLFHWFCPVLRGCMWWQLWLQNHRVSIVRERDVQDWRSAVNSAEVLTSIKLGNDVFTGHSNISPPTPPPDIYSKQNVSNAAGGGGGFGAVYWMAQISIGRICSLFGIAFLPKSIFFLQSVCQYYYCANIHLTSWQMVGLSCCPKIDRFGFLSLIRFGDVLFDRSHTTPTKR